MTRNLLVVDDDAAAILVMSRMLGELGDVRFATNGQDALRLARESRPSVIVLDAQLPDLSGYAVCAQLKADPVTADIPVIFVTSNTDEDFEVSGFGAGASDYVTKPVRAAALLARVRTQIRLAETTTELRRLTMTDALTGLANRRRFDDALEHEWRRGRRVGAPLSLMLVDVDHFKRYNDHYGHPAGDDCLRRIAQLLQAASQRAGDLVARLGGEEFALLMPETDRHGALHVARSVLHALTTAALEHQASPVAAHVTASLGLACLDSASPLWTRWILDDPPLQSGADTALLTIAADQALYAAKAAGRAQLALYEISPPAPAARDNAGDA